MSTCKKCGGTGRVSAMNTETGKMVEMFCACSVRACPFCGAAVNEKTQFQTSILTHKEMQLDARDPTKGIHPENVEYALECGQCGSNGPLASSKVAAIAAWNKRSAQQN